MKRLVAVGDSLANADRSWAFHLAEAHGFDLTRVSVGGATSRSAMDQLPKLAGRRFDVGLLSVGANDAFAPWPVSEFATNTRVIVDAMTEICDRVVVHTLPAVTGSPFGAAPSMRARVSAINDVIRQLPSVVLVDAQDLAGRELMGPDQVHPTERGQIEIYERAAAALGLQVQARVAVSQRPGPLLGVKSSARAIARRFRS